MSAAKKPAGSAVAPPLRLGWLLLLLAMLVALNGMLAQATPPEHTTSNEPQPHYQPLSREAPLGGPTTVVTSPPTNPDVDSAKLESTASSHQPALKGQQGTKHVRHPRLTPDTISATYGCPANVVNVSTSAGLAQATGAQTT